VSTGQMHPGMHPIDDDLVRRLIAAQFPEWAELVVRRWLSGAPWGWPSATGMRGGAASSVPGMEPAAGRGEGGLPRGAGRGRRDLDPRQGTDALTGDDRVAVLPEY
jgi:hypothetical protein